MKYLVKYTCESNIGKCRNSNQDNFICDGQFMKEGESTSACTVRGSFLNTEPTLLGVFDGMGGEACGEIASLIAAEIASETIIDGNPAEKLQEFCDKANEKICSFSAEHSVGSMGTTAALLAFTRDEITLCNIGDSKVFHFSGKHLRQISTDHYGAAAYGTKPPLSQNLGIPPEELIIEPFLARGKYTDGDLFLICSDGLTDMVETEEIEEILSEPDLDGAVDELVLRSLENGGKDNITVILCKIEKEKESLFSRLFGKN